MTHTFQHGHMVFAYDASLRGGATMIMADEASREALRRFYDCEGQIRSVRPALETDCWACGGSTDARLFCASCGWTRDKQIEIMRTGRTT